MSNKPMILVVEDDAAVRNLMAVTLETREYRYHLAQNGTEALIEATTHQPDVMLLDLGLPDMDGVEIIRKVRSWSAMPIIVISARSEDSDKVEALDAGADDFLTKPFSVDEMLSLHTRIVLMTTLILLLAGTVFFWLAERTNAETLAGRGEGEKVMNAFFQSVTMRTAGFNSVDLSRFTDGSKLFSSVLMMIGASPASTGGGIKTTTFTALVLLMLSVVRGENEINIARRRLSDDVIRRALAVAALFLAALVTGTLVISFIENGRFPLADMLFEASSAMGTVGVSAIGTPALKPASRAVLLPMMSFGRVGPLTLAVAVARRQGKTRSPSKYPEERIMVG